MVVTERLKAACTVGDDIGSHVVLVRLQWRRSVEPWMHLGAMLTTAVTDSPRVTSAESDEPSGIVSTSGSLQSDASTAGHEVPREAHSTSTY